MTVGMTAAIPLVALIGALLPILLLRRSPRSGRGWCHRCQTPDLWIVPRATPRSRAWALLTWLAHAAMTLCAIQLARSGGSTDPRDWAILGLLLAAEVLVGQRSRAACRHVIRCRMCEAEAEPQDLRRAGAGKG